MEGYLIATIVSGVILVVGTLWYLFYYLSVNFWNPSGKGMEKKTTRILKKFAGIRRFRVLSNITLSVDGKTAVIENMLVGFFGILLVHTCGARGEYYGKLDSETWLIHTDEGRNKERIPNPLLQQQEAAALLRTLFSRNSLYNIPIEHVTYMTSKAKKAGVFISHSDEIILPGKLGKYLGKSKFEKDTGLDVEKVVQVVLSGASK